MDGLEKRRRGLREGILSYGWIIVALIGFVMVMKLVGQPEWTFDLRLYAEREVGKGGP